MNKSYEMPKFSQLIDNIDYDFESIDGGELICSYDLIYKDKKYGPHCMNIKIESTLINAKLLAMIEAIRELEFEPKYSGNKEQYYDDVKLVDKKVYAILQSVFDSYVVEEWVATKVKHYPVQDAISAFLY
jgi:hypothetical protein